MERIFGKVKRLMRKFDGKTATAKFMSGVLIASSLLSSVSPVMASTAYAAEAEPDTATVTLVDTEHGKLSFGDTDESVKTVEVGSKVTVNVTPDEGYFADSLTVFSDSDEGTPVDVEDGTATFEVTGDSTVTGTFYENGSAGSDTLKAVNVDEGKSVKDVESYVRKNADPQYVGSDGELSRADVLTVTTTVVDGSKLPDATLDTLWADTDGDGFSDNWTAMLSQAVSHAVLFEVDPDSDYYVGWAGADITGGKLTDWGAAENNADANMRDGFIVDEATGLVYVPKSYTQTNEQGEPIVATSRIQLVYTVADATAQASFDFSTSIDGVSGDVAGSGKVSVPVSAAYSKVTLVTDDTALDSVKEHTIDSVTVNGIEYTSDMDMWSYDAESGTLEFKMAPAGIHAMSVKMSNNLGKDVVSFFTSFAATRSANNLGTWEFKSAPSAGLSFTTSGKNTYGGSYSGYTLPAVENPSAGNYENKTVNQAMGWQSVDTSKLVSGRYSIERTAEIYAQDTGTVKIGTAAKLALTCGHVGVDANFNYNPSYNEGAAMSDTLGQHIRVVSVYGDKAIIGVTVPTSHTQAGAGFFEISWKVTNGYLKLTKTSANPSITDGNDCYSLAGAVFTVYNASGSAVGTLTTDENGNTNTLELPEGTYTVKETTAPEGYYAAPDQQVTVHSSQTTTVSVADNPAGDPMFMMVGKYDGEKTYNGEANLPQGAASLKGAEFTVEYYDTVDYDSYDALKSADVEPTRTWVLKTDKDGYCDLSSDYLVSGDDFYYDSNGNITIPRGSVVIYESKAPNGYNLNDEVNFQKIQENPTEGVVTFNTPQVPDSVKRGGVSVQKVDSQTGETPQGDANLKGIEFSIINDNENAVIVDGTSYAPGAVVKTIVTDDKGYAATADDALPFGKYIIRETATNDGYLNTAEDMHATVSEDGKVYSFTASDDIVRGGVKVSKRDLETDGKTPLGSASLDGTTFEVKYLGANPVIVDGVSYSKGQVVKTLTIKDGEASTTADLLPFGAYSLQEVKSGEGYLLTDGTAYKFDITEDGSIVNPVTGGVVRNQVKRGDLEFTKKADDGADRLAGVAFKVTSKTTGESHVIVTDENGYLSTASSWNKHTADTNGNDWALAETGTIDSSKLDATSGIWFGGTTADDAKGALPYDTYTIEELRCTANEGYQLIETSIIISRDAVVYDFGTLDDIKATIVTNAYDPDDSDSYIGVGETKIADKVTYANLIAGRDYKLVAELHDSKTGDAITDADGKTISVEKTFTAAETSGFEVVELSLSTFDLGGKTVTVYEKLYDEGGSLIAKHTDKDDVSQQVTVIEPEIGTTATDGADGDKTVSTDDEVTIVDAVAYKNLIPGKEYTVKGTLHIKKTDDEGKVTEEALEVDGKPVTAETTFTPEKSDGTVNVTFKFSSLALKGGTQIVAFESLVHQGHELAVHADIEDMQQTVTLKNPSISTTAVDGVDADKNVVTDDETVIVDTVEYKNLVPGKEYTLKGTINVKKTDSDGKVTGKALEVDGKPVTAETTFTPEKSDGTVSVTFTFDSRAIADKTELVVFESLERGGNELVAHADIEDVNQMVIVTKPSIGTTAVDGVDGDKNVVTDDETVIVDTVEYKNLIPGKEYTVKGSLHIKKTDDEGKVTEEALEVDGKPVTAETTFTPDTADGTVDVTFTFDSRSIEDETDIVAFESLEKNGVELVAHTDIKDEKQTTTVTRPEIGTTATDGHDGDKNVVTDGKTVIVDTVEYKNLIPGKEYTVKGTLHVKKTDNEGKVTEEDLEVDGKPVTAETTFTPEKVEGSVDVTFTFDATGIADKTDIVAFESLEKNGVELTAHADIEDENQTTTVHTTKVGTTATDGLDGDKTVIADAETTITDEVGYQSVLTGTGYTMAGILMDADTGLPILTGDGNEKYTEEDVKAFLSKLSDALGLSGLDEKEGETLPVNPDMDALKALVEENADLLSHMVYETQEFTPTTDGGRLSMDFAFDSNDVIDRLSGETKDIVVFEVLFKGSLADAAEDAPVIVASELDLDNEGQTVTLTPSEIGTTATDKSDGDHTLMAGKDSVITDTVSYEGLIPGKEYTLKATLYDRKTGEPLSIGDKHVTAELKFTPNSQSGTVEIDLGAFDSSDLDGHTLVVFEELYKQTTDADGNVSDILVAEHKDINDEGQSVTVTTTPPGSFYGKTGGNMYAVVVAIAALVVLAGGCAVYAVKNRRQDAKSADDGTDSGKDGSDSEA